MAEGLVSLGRVRRDSGAPAADQSDVLVVVGSSDASSCDSRRTGTSAAAAQQSEAQAPRGLWLEAGHVRVALVHLDVLVISARRPSRDHGRCFRSCCSSPGCRQKTPEVLLESARRALSSCANGESRACRRRRPPSIVIGAYRITWPNLIMEFTDN